MRDRFGTDLDGLDYESSVFWTTRDCSCGHTGGLHGVSVNQSGMYFIGYCMEASCDCGRFDPEIKQVRLI